MSSIRWLVFVNLKNANWNLMERFGHKMVECRLTDSVTRSKSFNDARETILELPTTNGTSQRTLRVDKITVAGTPLFIFLLAGTTYSKPQGFAATAALATITLLRNCRVSLFR